MENTLHEQLEGLLIKYTELLVGQTDEETLGKVKAWMLYSHISKSMPALAKQWNESYPDAKEAMKQLVLEVKQLNETHRQGK